MNERKSVFPGFAEAAARRRSLFAALVEQRQASGLTQAEVAERMGTSQSAVARLEAGELDVRLSTVDRYVAALDRRLDWRLAPGSDEEGSS
jgi:transcriptional regulator with XRE-family HTH domain